MALAGCACRDQHHHCSSSTMVAAKALSSSSGRPSQYGQDQIDPFHWWSRRFTRGSIICTSSDPSALNRHPLLLLQYRACGETSATRSRAPWVGRPPVRPFAPNESEDGRRHARSMPHNGIITPGGISVSPCRRWSPCPFRTRGVATEGALSSSSSDNEWAS
jgi:hypothetical protein